MDFDSKNREFSSLKAELKLILSIWTELNYNSTAKTQRTQRKLGPKVRRCESETV